MNTKYELIDEDGPVKPPVWQFIRRKPASKRSAVNESQARLLAKLINMLEGAVLAHFNLADLERIDLNRFKEIWDLPEYNLFVEGAYACGFVCTDGKSEGDLDMVNSRPREVVASWSFPELRQYVHFLLRSEKWADGYSSPILHAIRSGALQKVADRLESDDSLYERF